MEIAEILLITNEATKSDTKLGALLTKLSEEGETGDVLKKTNQFTLYFGKFVLIFHNPKECQEFFESFVDKLTTDVIDENGVRITREEDFKRSSFIINEKVDEEENPIDDSSEDENTNKFHREYINQFLKERDEEEKRKEFLQQNPEFEGATSITFVLKK